VFSRTDGRLPSLCGRPGTWQNQESAARNEPPLRIVMPSAGGVLALTRFCVDAAIDLFNDSPDHQGIRGLFC
jgi:hypothetical protein